MHRIFTVIAAGLVVTACATTTNTATPAITATAETLTENQQAAEENAPASNSASDTGSNVATPSHIDPANALAGATETYAGETYAFDYPMDWFVNEDTNGDAALTSFEVEGALNTDELGLSPDEMLMTFTSADESYEMEADILLTELAREGVEVLAEMEMQLPNGAPAYRVQYMDSIRGETVTVFTEVADQALVINGYGNLVIFDNILNTVRPTDPNELVEDGMQPGAETEATAEVGS